MIRTEVMNTLAHDAAVKSRTVGGVPFEVAERLAAAAAAVTASGFGFTGIRSSSSPTAATGGGGHSHLISNITGSNINNAAAGLRDIDSLISPALLVPRCRPSPPPPSEASAPLQSMQAQPPTVTNSAFSQAAPATHDVKSPSATVSHSSTTPARNMGSAPGLATPAATVTSPPAQAPPTILNYEKAYSSQPTCRNVPENNICSMIEYRGSKVAAFKVEGRELICLPQSFDLFLKHLVGGLHTVYTKLKRLDICPVVCNVEQVRILRGLGAIQPGVNRCKLISCKDFDTLYEDCTNSNARPGRPPKRSSPQDRCDDTQKTKRSKYDSISFASFPENPMVPFEAKNVLSSLLPSSYQHYPHLASLPFMPLSHPLLPPTAASIAMASQLGAFPRTVGSFVSELSAGLHGNISHAAQSLPTYAASLGKEAYDLPSWPSLRMPKIPKANEGATDGNVNEEGDNATAQDHPEPSRHNDDNSPPSIPVARRSVHDCVAEPTDRGVQSAECQDESANFAPAETPDSEVADNTDNTIAEITENSREEGSPIDGGALAQRVTDATPSEVEALDATGVEPLIALLENLRGALEMVISRLRSHQETQENTFEELKTKLDKERSLRLEAERKLTLERASTTSLARRLSYEKRRSDDVSGVKELHNSAVYEHENASAAPQPEDLTVRPSSAGNPGMSTSGEEQSHTPTLINGHAV